MSLLYDVYGHPQDGEWGVCVRNGQVHTARVKTGLVKKTTLPGYKLAQEVTRHVRTGFVKGKRAKYLYEVLGDDGIRHASFGEKHPELTQSGGRVVFTTLSLADDTKSLAQKFGVLMDKTDVRPETIDAWLERVKTASEYLVAPSSSPAFALVLATWAIENQRVLLADVEGIPLELPARAPLDWETWLTKYFSREETQVALAQLGWSAKDLMVGMNTDRQETSATTGWYAELSSAAF